MNILLSDRRSSQLLLFCASLSFSSVLLEELGLRLSWLWVWLLVFICWRYASLKSGKAFSRQNQSLNQSLNQPQSWETLAIFAILCFAGYHLLFYFFEINGQFSIKNPNLYGDLPFHLEQIRYLEKLDHFWPDNPIFFADHLRYSFGINWLTALFLRAQLPMGFVLTVSSFVFLYLLVSELWNWFGLWGVLAFFGSGGGWGYTYRDQMRFWQPGPEIAWKNLFLAVFVTQRGFWFALPAGILILRMMFRHFSTSEGLTNRQKKIVTFIWAILPFFHLHSFVLLTAVITFLCYVSSGAAIFYYFVRRSWIPAFFIFHSVGAGNVQRTLRFVTNWMSESDPLWLSWIKNFGLWAFLPVAGIVLAWRFVPRSDYRRPMIIFSVVSFVFFSHMMLAPWSWDQIKIILWLYLILTALVASLLAEVARSWWFALLMVSFYMPGLMQFWGGHPAFLSNQVIWSSEDAQAARQLVSDIPPMEGILIAPVHNHPLFAAGQPVVAGYMGHLWSHGIDVGGLEDAEKAKILGKKIDDPRWQKMKVKYLLWGPEERKWLNLQEPPAEAQWIKLKSIDAQSLYYHSL
ncbi:MAG: hypothetical protein C5B49_12640 [Bdellovibrio sp.]|nr:MAG: hypothetical protein C5B49_12640 [Bdellovibrio sp.]